MPFKQQAEEVRLLQKEADDYAYNTWQRVWNTDPMALATMFAPNGTYWDTLAGEVPGAHVPDMVIKPMQKILPGHRYEIRGPVTTGYDHVTGRRTVGIPWVLIGTSASTGRRLSVPGVDLVEFVSDRIGDPIYSARTFTDARDYLKQAFGEKKKNKKHISKI